MTLHRPRPVLAGAALPLVLLAFATPLWAASGPIEALEQAAMGRLAVVQAGDVEPTVPFTTDGCSGGLSAAWQSSARLFPGFAGTWGDSPPWEDCCVAHDRAYWRGPAEGGYTNCVWPPMPNCAVVWPPREPNGGQSSLPAGACPRSES